MPDWSTAVDIYCERTDAAFWSEPVNAVTNGAFLLAAWLAFRLWRGLPDRDFPVLALILVTVAVGGGSFAFHTLATRGAALLDVIPIVCFIYGYLYLALRRFLQFSTLAAMAWVGAFALGSFGVEWVLPPGFLNGSGSYLPAFGAMVLVGVLARGTAAGRLVLAAAATFALSLTFRSIDQAVCIALPLGTHFLWHSLNAVVLYLLLAAAMKVRSTVAATPPDAIRS